MSKSILFVGGGTGGHIIPLVAVMQAFQKVSQAPCHYVGSAADMQAPAIAQSDLAFERHVIKTGKLNRYLTWKHIPEFANIAMGIIQAEQVLKKIRPVAVFSKGGSASVPVARAAAKLGIPVLCHETDVVPGLANRLVAKRAQTVFTAFPTKYYQQLPAEKAVYVGQPVRAVLREAFDGLPLSVGSWNVDPNRPLITVIGGSQGGRGLNKLVQQAWSGLLAHVQLVHITGPADFEEYQKLATEFPENLLVQAFVHQELPRLVQASTLLISRSGGTIFELAAARKPAILVPLPTAAQDHQRANAQVLLQAKAALVLDQEAATGSQLADMVRSLLADTAHQQQLASAIATFDRPDAAEQMAQSLLKYCS